MMVTQHVTDVLAQKALDALPELLDAVGVGLGDAPGPVWRVRRARREAADTLLRAKIRRDVGYQILERRKSPHGLDSYRLVHVQLTQARHAHQPGHTIYLRRTRPALSCLSIPSHPPIGCRFRLDLVDGIEDDHTLPNPGGINLQLSRASIPPPHPESRRTRLRSGAGVAALRGPLATLNNAGERFFRSRHLFSSMTRFRCSGISGIVSRESCASPFGPRRMTMLNLPKFGSFSG